MAWTHVVAALASVAAGGLFAAVGLLLLRRAPPEPEPRRALVALSVWWLGIGLTTLTNAWLVWAGVADNLPAAVAARSAGIAAAGAAIWGIIAYLAYLHTGSHAAGRPVAWAYGVLVAGTLAFIWWGEPNAVHVGDWTVDLRAEPSPVGSAVATVLPVAFLLPPVVAGGLLLRLRRRSDDPEQRRRILAVGVGVPLWVLLHLLARLSDADWWQFTTRVLVGVVVAVLVAVTYVGGPRPGRSDARTAGRRGLEQRVRDLV